MVEALGNIELAQRVISTGKGSGFDVHPIDAANRWAPADADRQGRRDARDARRVHREHPAPPGTYRSSWSRRSRCSATASGGVQGRATSRLLWHGSRLTNWCGILSPGCGSRRQALVDVYMFGKGVYFADMVSKSPTTASPRRPTQEGPPPSCRAGHRTSCAEYEATPRPRAGKGHTWGKGNGARPGGARTLPGDGGLKVPTGKGKPTDQDGRRLLSSSCTTRSRSSKFVLRAVQVPAALLSGRARRGEKRERHTTVREREGRWRGRERGGRIQ